MSDKYQRAANLWASRKWDIPLEKIASIDFESVAGCETCGSGGGTHIEVTFVPGSRPLWEWHELGITPGQFIEECVALLPEVEE